MGLSLLTEDDTPPIESLNFFEAFAVSNLKEHMRDRSDRPVDTGYCLFQGIDSNIVSKGV